MRVRRVRPVGFALGVVASLLGASLCGALAVAATEDAGTVLDGGEIPDEGVTVAGDALPGEEALAEGGASPEGPGLAEGTAPAEGATPIPDEPAAASGVVGGAGSTASREAVAAAVARAPEAVLRALDAFAAEADALLAHAPLVVAARRALGIGEGLAGASDEPGAAPGATIEGAFAWIAEADGSVLELARATLGLEGVRAFVTGSGPDLVIDPDEAAVCAARAARRVFGEDESWCREVASRLLVELSERGPERGLLRYRIGGEAVLEVEYAPGTTRFELEVRALNEIERAAGALRDGAEAGAMAASGRVVLSVEAGGVEPGGESGVFELAVTEALRAEEADGSRFELAPSTVLSATVDADRGALGATLELGALHAVTAFGDGTTGSLRFGGVGGRLEVGAGHGPITVSGLDPGRGPVRWSLDGLELVRLTVRPFGFRVERGDGRLVLDSGFDASLLGQDRSAGARSRAYATLRASAGTVFESLADGVFRTAGGSVRADSKIEGGARSERESLRLRGGDCAGSYPWLGRLPTAVPCP